MTTTAVHDEGPATDVGLRACVGSTAARLQRNYLDLSHTASGAEARARLAELRTYSSRPVMENPLALGHVLLMLDPPLSEGETGRGDAPSASENAAFHALTLFGVHMQSATQPMHSTETSFAAACGRLFAQSSSKSIKPRFDAMQSAGDEITRITHLRSLVTLLRSQQIAFDYGRFAGDLRSLTYADKRNGVLLRWGRDFGRGAFRSSATGSPAR
ncbi:type I-E CRISPR-associated protein Cse2/CasB [Corynebacterium sp. LK2510]|uniref:type I-E CRISPR-associated protein Cse2/CasB n=1 Tax=Corynebacterium sp. LK2510 TaxID=3110472 RepID=UPI0034CF8B07